MQMHLMTPKMIVPRLYFPAASVTLFAWADRLKIPSTSKAKNVKK